MKCKFHPLDPGVGVCAVCLRDRLHALVALQSSYHSQLDSVSSTPSRLKHDREPHPPLHFPRSVSPYVSHRRSVASSSSPFHSHSHLFYSTPQLTTTTTTTTSTSTSKKNKSSIFSTLFRFRSDKARLPSDMSPADQPKPSSSSSGWFSLWRSRRKSRGRSEEVGGSTIVTSVSRRDRGQCRGMSPGDEEAEEEGGEIYDSSPEWRMPAPTPLRRNRKHHHYGSSGSGPMSGFAVCLSPLVRPSPQRRSQVVAGEVGFSGEIRSGPKFDGYDGSHHRQSHRRGGSGRAVLHVNRSRKLSDIGRFH